MQYTSYYNLPQYEANDKTAWLTIFNQAMLDIDTGIHGAKAAADSADATATAAQSAATQASSDVSALTASLNTVIGNINTINSLIGNGTPTTTDHTLIGAINELHADQGDLANLTTTDKSSLVAAINEVAGDGGTVEADDVTFDNTASGLSATNVQDAIDELASKGVVYTLAERKIGKFGNDDLYEKSYKLTGDVTDGQIVDATLTDSYVKEVVSIGGSMRTNSSSVVPLPIGFGTTYTVNLQLVQSGLQFVKSGSITLTEEVITVRYTKN